MSLVNRLFGRRLASDEDVQQKITVVTGIPALGLDALGSAAYGPEAALTILIPLGALGLSCIGPVTLVIVVLLGILYISYRQTIPAYPNGGGSFTVAKENLGAIPGLIAAAALMLDYTLNVAVGISAGIGALVSALPVLQPHTLGLCLGMLALLTAINLRGLRESGVALALPTYLFVLTLSGVLVVGIFQVITHHGHPTPIVTPPHIPAAAAGITLWLLLRAFASGCTAMTGVEAVSNGVNAFAAPPVKRAQWTLTIIVGILAVLLLGIAYLAKAYGIDAMDESKQGYQSVLSQLVAAVVGKKWFYFVTIASILSVLALSANTSYAGFPRLCRLVALDDYLPRSFALLGRRLVYTVGIGFLTTLSGILLIIFGGITDRLIPLFAVGAFLAFTMSQAGMVQHWRRNDKGAKTRVALVINAVGTISTSIALGIILIAKFTDGAWITVVIIPSLVVLFLAIKRHYDSVEKQVEVSQPMNVQRIEPPVVLVPIKNWNAIAERALRFGMRLSEDVIAVHVNADCAPEQPKSGDSDSEQETADQEAQFRKTWKKFVEDPIEAANLCSPKLLFLPSPFRRIMQPLRQYIAEIKVECPGRIVAVVIPELVEKSWWAMVLHNHRATALKAFLWWDGDRDTVVIDVPWYIDSHVGNGRDGGDKQDNDSRVSEPVLAKR